MSIDFLASRDGEAGPGVSRGVSNPEAMNSGGRGGPDPRSEVSSQPPPSAVPTPTLQASSTDVTDEEDDDDLIGNAAVNRPSRLPHPTYTEEQKFFIMFARIMQDKGWPEIENDFTEIWGVRTKDGLTSVYYRIRKSWNLEDVLKSGVKPAQEDRNAVREKAGRFSRAFLVKIGYLPES